MALFNGSMLLYLLAAAAALLLSRRQRTGTLVSQVLCMAAAVLGAAAALGQIFFAGGAAEELLFRSTLPLFILELRIDALAAYFILALSVLALPVSLFSIGYLDHYHGHRNTGLFNCLYALFILSMFLVAAAGNGIFFLVAWEAMSLLSYFLVVFEGEKEETQRAGTLYIIMTHIGTAFIWLALMLMVRYTGSFDMFASNPAIPAAVKDLMFLCFLIGFGTKAGVVPLHIWLPYAHPAAPSNVSALMSGVMIKTALYGLLRFVLGYLQVQHTWWGGLILALGLVSAVLGVAYAFMENNIKGLLAFCSVENIGIALIGLGVSFISLAQGNGLLGSLALAACLFHIFNHALFKGGLFLGAGAVQQATGSKEMEELGGLLKRMPVTGFLVLCFCLAISALPPMNGFIGEWLTLQSLFASFAPGQPVLNILLILAVAGLGLAGAMAAASFVKLFGISFLGLPRTTQAEEAREVPRTMQAGMALLMVCCLFLGLCPALFLRVLDPLTLALTGEQVSGQLTGGILPLAASLSLSGRQIFPAGILFLVVLVAAAALSAFYLLAGRQRVRHYTTWDCGFPGLGSRMQYSATGFAKPLRIVFRLLYRTGRELEVEKGQSRYFPRAITYTVSTESIFEKYLYGPVVYRLIKFSRRTKISVQTGSVHLYLIYIFITLLALMIYNRLV